MDIVKSNFSRQKVQPCFLFFCLSPRICKGENFKIGSALRSKCGTDAMSLGTGFKAGTS